MNQQSEIDYQIITDCYKNRLLPCICIQTIIDLLLPNPREESSLALKMKLILNQLDEESIDFQDLEQQIYYGLIYPQIGTFCDACSKNISQTTKIIIENEDYCVGCFAKQPNYIDKYRVISCLDFLLFADDWSAAEELKMMEAIDKFGFDWESIANHIDTDKDPSEISLHYEEVYLNSKDHLPPFSTEEIIRKFNLGGDDSQECFEDQQQTKFQSIQPKKKQFRKRRQRCIFSTRKPRCQSASHEIKGYYPKINEFEEQYDSEAEILLADLQFLDSDTAEITQLKENVIKVYNNRLAQRYKRVDFVFNRKKLDLKYQNQKQAQSTRKAKQIEGMLKVFQRFHNPTAHQKLIRGVAELLQKEQRIAELKLMKQKGIKKLQDVKDQKLNAWDMEQILKLKKTRQKQDVTKNNQFQLNPQQLRLCATLSIPPIKFLMIKLTFQRQNEKKKLTKKQFEQMLNPSLNVKALYDYFSKTIGSVKHCK